MAWIRGAATVVLLVGPLSWLRRSSTLPTGWHPLLVLCAWSLTVLLAGVSGHLVAGVVAVVVVSLLILARELVADRSNVVATLRDPALLIFAATLLLLAVLVHGQLFTHYDNFSHWGLVVAVMLDDAALPTSADDIVTFPTYPLGGASLPYLANLLIGRAEWVSMLAHDAFTISCALPLFSAAGRRWGAGLLMYAVAALALLTHITTPFSLLVDALVAGLGGCLLALLLIYRQQLRSQPWPLALLAMTLVTIKSSGIFFVVLATVLAVLLVARPTAQHQRTWSRAALWAVTLTSPWLVWVLWRWHVQRTFPAATESKHSVSLSRFGTVLGEKTGADVRSILGDLALRVVQDGRLWLLLVGVLLAGALAVRSKALRSADHRRVLLVLLVTVILWELSLALMYLYSMPQGEALALAGFHRYQGTIHLVLMIVLLGVLATWWSETPRLHPGQVVAAGMVMAVPLTMGSSRSLLDLPQPALRTQLQSALAEVTVPPNAPVCLLLEKADAGYRAWMTRYLLQHRDVRAIVLAPDAVALPERLADCEVSILLDPRPHTRELLRHAGVPATTMAQLPLVFTP